MPPKILIVEDNFDSREMLTTLLSSEGYTVITAEDGQDGLARLESDPPDLIITDIEMPNLDGIDLIKRLRQRPDWKQVPIVVVSAYGSGNLVQAMDAGANAAMRKPIPIFNLFTMIQRLLSAIAILMHVCY
ncbi:MAG TPA: response regulator [Blastocatellia bacterium]|nr:response regulator [Blastocatellia bacterium]